jgi:ligand-binding sensor domain-containing protein
VALNVGIALYEIEPDHVKETYKQLGLGLDKFIPVNQILIVDKEIWAATYSGLASSSLEIPVLQAPNNWTNYTVTNGLPSNEINALFWYDSTVVVGTNEGISFFRDGWLGNELEEVEVTAIHEYAGQLVVGATDGVYLRSEAGSWQRLGSAINNITSLGVDAKGQLWLAKKDGGLSLYDPSSDNWVQFIPNGPGGNGFKDVVLDANGVLWCASDHGIFRYDNILWKNFSKETALVPSNDFRCIIVDKENKVWASSWGGGIVIFEDRSNSLHLEIINEQNGLSGTANKSSYVVVNRMAVDSEGNIWILNREAADYRPVAVVSPENEWQYFSTSDGIKSYKVTAIEVDRYNRVWIGTEGSGIVVLDHGNTPFDKSDDDLSQDLSTADGLESSNIRALAEDHDGVMWIGTPEGLNYWYEGEVHSWYGLISDDINTIAVDARNNKWIGTSGGISVLSADGYTITKFSTHDDPLTSDNVQGFAFNNESGEVYIATDYGLSLLETPYSAPKANLSQVRGYPNPFKIENDRSRFKVVNLADEATVNFFTIDGALVRNIPESQILGSGSTEWDGRNDRGELVANGIYIFVVSTESGMSAVGKVAVIRK